MSIGKNTPTFTDKSGDYMTERMYVSGKDTTFEEIVSAISAETVWLQDIQVHNFFVSWTRRSTDAEKQEMLDMVARQKERTEKWERETYLRLREKFGDSND